MASWLTSATDNVTPDSTPNGTTDAWSLGTNQGNGECESRDEGKGDGKGEGSLTSSNNVHRHLEALHRVTQIRPRNFPQSPGISVRLHVD